MTGLPDEAIEAFFLGDSHDAWEQDDALASLASDVLMGATGPAPTPSPALRAFLGEPDAGSAPAPEAARPLAAVPPAQPDTMAGGPGPSDRETNVVPLFRTLRLTVGIAAAAGVAAATLAVAGNTGVLPEPVMQAVSWVVEAVTPFELRDPDRTVTDDDHVPGRGPTSTPPAGPLSPGVGPGPAAPGVAPGQPAATTTVVGPGAPGQPGSNRPVTPPASVPAGVPRPVQPPGAVDRGGNPPAPVLPVVPGPPGAIAPPAGGGSATPPTTSVDRARQAPDGGTVPSAVTSAPSRR